VSDIYIDVLNDILALDAGSIFFTNAVIPCRKHFVTIGVECTTTFDVTFLKTLCQTTRQQEGNSIQLR
jgi:hypothetical protein